MVSPESKFEHPESRCGAWRLVQRLVPCCLIAVLWLSGCRTAMTPGSLYRQTGRYRDLLAEPTFDLGAGPAEGTFYVLNVPHYDADGHGLFDVPIVFCEQLFLAPVWPFSWLLHLTGADPRLGAQQPAGAGPATGSGRGRATLGWVVAVPGAALYAAGFVAIMGFDTVAHDVPVIVFGFPLRALERFGSGR